MFFLLKLFFIFVFGVASTRSIETNPAGRILMGAISFGITVWLVYDVANNPSYYRQMFDSSFDVMRQLFQGTGH